MTDHEQVATGIVDARDKDVELKVVLHDHAHYLLQHLRGRRTREQRLKLGVIDAEQRAENCFLDLTPLKVRIPLFDGFRLLLGVIAYNLGNLLRRLVLPVAIQSWSLTSLRERLFKTGGRLIRHARYFVLQLAEGYLTGNLFRQILGRIERLAWYPT